MPILPMIIGAWSWFKGSTVGRYALAIGAFIGFVVVVYFKGRSDKAKDQHIDDLEFGADIRRKTDEAERRHEANMAQLPEDDDARRAALSERLRKLRAGDSDN